MKKLTLNDVKQSEEISEFLIRTENRMKLIGYTDHGRRHAKIVSERSGQIAKKFNFHENEIEYAKIAGYCHDIGNFLDRKFHHLWGSILFYQVFRDKTDDLFGLNEIIQAISNHDKEDITVSSKIAAVLVIADKSDVSRDRVLLPEKNISERDIHNRVNFAVKKSYLDISSDNTYINLILELDTKIASISEYVEIFSERMNYCRKASNFLGSQFGLMINNYPLMN